MLREDIQAALKDAIKNGRNKEVGTLRLITAALKDRDIAARSKGNNDGINDDEFLGMLQTMIKQRQESAKLYREGGREELALSEEEEIETIRRFMPEQMDEAAIAAAITAALEETGAESIKDMGKVMGLLKQRHAGQMDFAVVSGMIKQKLLAEPLARRRALKRGLAPAMRSCHTGRRFAARWPDMALPQHFMDELRRRVTLSDVIGKRVVLKKRGNRRTGLCPFHNEKTPSFHVRDDEGLLSLLWLWGEGDAITFLRERRHGFMDAVRSLAEMAGMDVPKPPMTRKPVPKEIVPWLLSMMPHGIFSRPLRRGKRQRGVILPHAGWISGRSRCSGLAMPRGRGLSLPSVNSVMKKRRCWKAGWCGVPTGISRFIPISATA